MTYSMAWRRTVAFAFGLCAVACGDDSSHGSGSGDASESGTGGSGSNGTTSAGESDTNSSAADTTTGETGIGPGPESGLLACPAGQECTLVVVAEALDDRVEVYAARGQGPVYRGAIDFDLKPNPMGDYSGENLDEPYGMAITDQGLAVLLGHYPMRVKGSLVVMPHDLLAMQEDGATLAKSSYFDGGTFSAGVVEVALDEEEPIFVRAHPSGRLLVGVFANDLTLTEDMWTNPGKLLVIDPVSGEVGKRVLDMGSGFQCEGAWSVVPLDGAMNSIALGCDGDDGAVILDVSGVGEGSVADAAAAVNGCAIDVLLPNRTVRYTAPDGEGGVLLVDSTPNYDVGGGHLDRYDGDCQMIGAAAPLDQQYWQVREIVHLPNAAGPRWLMPIGFGAQARGVHVIGDMGAGPEVCNDLPELDMYWMGTPDMVEVHPYALALTRAGDGVAIGAGNPDPQKSLPGYGRVLWVDLDTTVDPCVTSPITNIIDLTASAPAVAEDDPTTWRRGPNQVLVQQYG